MFAELPDVRDAYEGDIPEAAEARVQYLLDVASARLVRLIPSLQARIEAESAAGDESLGILTRDVVIQAVLRQYTSPVRGDWTQQSQSAGPFTLSFNTGSRASRGLFYDEELNLLRPVQTGQRIGTINLCRPAWERPS